MDSADISFNYVPGGHIDLLVIYFSSMIHSGDRSRCLFICGGVALAFYN
jgi:hypothetical protein